MTPGRRLAIRAAAAVFVFAVALPASAHAAVSTFADYRGRVVRAVEAVKAGEAAAADRRKALELAAKLHGLLPEREQVREQTRTIDVSDPALTRLLGELEAAGTSEDRAAVLSRIGRHLATLSGAVGAPGAAVRSDPAALQRLLSGVRTGPAAAESTWMQDLIDRVLTAIQEWLSGVTSTREGATRLRTALYAVMIVFAGLVAWIAWRGVRAWRRAVVRGERAGGGRSVPALVEAAEGLPEDAASFADKLAAQGRHREAVRALFGGAARTLGARGVLVRTRTRTNAELLAEVRMAAPAVEAPLRGLSDAFELAWYGHREPGEFGFISARALYDAVLAAPAAHAPVGGGERE